ncbi:MAG: D-alanine transaminase [Parasphingorhabdus sp.]|jgi:D-alanine transaminase
MGRIVYVNGEYVDESEARVSVFDRGFLFADGVYEVSTVLRGQLIENSSHLARLERSLEALGMPAPMDSPAIEAVQNEVIRRNNLDEGVIYLQVTRGVADRDFKFPKDTRATLVMFTQQKSLLHDPVAARGISVISVPDIRWRRRDIKTVALLAASMAKQAAVAAGADDAWLVEDGMVTEGSSNNAYIVTQDNRIITRQLSQDILHGITRRSVIDLAEQENLQVEERLFSLDEVKQASEAFITSASTFVYPVISLDGQAIGSGQPGPVAQKLRRLYIDRALSSLS